MFSLPMILKRSTDIDKPIAEVFTAIADFNTWSSWSPWLCQEPECPVTIVGQPNCTGHTQKWNGQRIGSGEMALVSITPNKRLEYDLAFIKPWKSKSKVAFDLESAGSGARVTWHMEGSVPIFLFFMRKMMTALVGGDYERGLSMLKEFLEKGEVLSKVHFVGEFNCQGFYYAGRRRVCSTSEVGPAMQEDFTALTQLMEKDLLPRPDFHFSFYHDYDFIKETCDYTSGFAYQTQPNTSGAGKLETGRVAAHRALKVAHLGPYRHLGNAWSTAMGGQRALKLKPLGSIPMYEIYANLPHEVEERDLLTEVHIPLR